MTTRTADIGDPRAGGELGALVAAHDWQRTPLGPIEHWPQSLRIALRILLGSRYAMWLGWGPELTFFYNDAYARMTLGAKHPWALGRSAREVWSEIWGDIGPRAESVIRTGAATWDEGLQLFLERSGFREETYHTFSYSPLPDNGEIGGMLCVVTEDTERIIGERRLRTLRGLSAALAASTTEREAVDTIGRQLAANPHDLPFTLTYLLEPDRRHARLAASSGVAPGDAVAPELVDLGAAPAMWGAQLGAAHGELVAVDDLGRRFTALPTGAWDRPPERAVLAPIAQQGQDRLAGFLVAGLNPYRPFDAPYRGFIEVVAGQIAAGIANSRAYDEERRRAEALAELDRAKTAFFSNVSHEFRTPLTLMLGPVEELLAAPSIDGTSREQLALVQRNGQRLLKLVNHLLDFSRIEAGRVQASYEPTDLSALTTDVASVFRSAVERAGLQLAIACDALSEPVYVDREMWEKIVLNLISNAFKYTLDGEIEVRLRAEPDRVELAVRDTGTGIPESELPKVWSRFHRVEGARGRTHEGSGIGLALVHELVKLHGGTVAVTSELGRGSVFTVSIPRGRAHLPPERIAHPRAAPSTALAASTFVEEALRWLPDAAPDTAPSGADELGRIAPDGGERAHILLADDNADMRQYVSRLLAEHYAVATAADGEDALEQIRAQRPDLVLTDVMMPRLDGFGLLRALRTDPRTATIPVIMLSARAGEEARVEGLDAGADDYLIKPFSARELIARVGGTLTLSRFRREALRREEELRAETASVLESITEGFVALDHAFRITYMNAEAERVHGVSRDRVVGRSLWDAFPDALGSPSEGPYQRVMTERIPTRFERHNAAWGKWFDVDVIPTRDGIAIYFRDVTDRKRRTEQLQALAAAATAVNGVLSVEEVLQTVTERARAIIGAQEALAVVRSPAPAARPVVARSWSTELAGGPGLAASLEISDGDADSVAAALVDRSGQPIGALRIAHKLGGAFTAADRAVVVQLAQTASVALTNAQLFRTAEDARAEAEAANRMKDQFLATLSHELRTPLNAIFGWARILRSGRSEASTVAEGLEVIERNAKIQAQLIEDLLDLSRIISGKLRLDVQSVSLVDVIEAAIAAIRPAAEARDIRLRTILDPLAGPITGDPARLQQIVWNLLSNAVKFTVRGGQVQVVLERVNSHVEISVSDTGIGIKPDFLPYVFERFRQADSSTTRKHGGLGLGLSIVRQLVEMHGGTVRAKSPGEGQGATFTVALPVAAARHRSDPRIPIDLPREPALDDAPLDGVRVLVVDDEPDARELIRRILGQSRATIETAGSAPEALDAIARWQPDVLLSDIGMPELDGYDLIRKVRARGLSGKVLPAIALTAFARPEDRRRALVAGFQTHVAKPVDPEELVAVVATLLGRTGGGPR